MDIFDLSLDKTSKLPDHYDIILVDSSHLLHRAMSAFSGLGFLDEELEEYIPTGAIYGFLNIVEKTYKRWAEPSGCKVIFCWEGGAGERRKLYPEYKGNRRVKLEDESEQLRKDLYKKEMFSQQHALLEFIEIAGWENCSIKGWEADDALGTLAKKLSEEDPEARIAIYSGDGDMHQCVTEKVHVIAGGAGRKRDKVFKIQDVEEKWGVLPSMLAALKGLAGDSGDNIPGCQGCGAGWAAKILGEYGSCAAAIEASKKGVLTGTYKGKNWKSPSLTKKISASGDMILLSEKLATINCDLEVEIIKGKKDQEAVLRFLNYYRIKSLDANLLANLD